MDNTSLPPDDLPPDNLNFADNLLRLHLEECLTKYFYEACDFEQQSLLSHCQWYITTYANAPTLVIDPPDSTINWRLLKGLVKLGSVLKQLARDAKIRVYPPAGMGTPFEMRVDELSVYRFSP